MLHNRCSHKGTQRVTDAFGNTGTFFRCPYHAWSYRTDGSLYAIPLRRGYANTGFESCEASKGMQAVGATHEHRRRSPCTFDYSTTITRATSRATTGCRTAMRPGHSS
ncbi:hypothetical protein WL86_23255 [Burkholderia diffusa]|nr:hypothetical protein WL86_23255 [Burkholderia diffusa]